MHPPGRGLPGARSPAHGIRYLATLLVLAALLSGPGLAQRRSELMDRVLRVLERSYFDRDFRRESLPTLGADYRARARDVSSAEAERALVRELLGRIPASHLALYSSATFDSMMAELTGRPAPTFGFQLVHLDGGYFVDRVLEEGVARRAGLLRGDRVLAIDGRAPADSPRLDWRSDDAALPDPPVHALLSEEGDELLLAIVRRAGEEPRELTLVAELDSGFEAMRRSARVYRSGDRRVGYVHLWFIHHGRQARFLRDLLRGAFADCDALVLDLRGRGGSAREARRIADLFGPRQGASSRAEAVWSKPVVALVDRGTRSAKEAIADDLRRARTALLVGERTAGALIPATFRRVGPGAVLMFPSTTLGERTRRVEGVGVPADFEVEYTLAYTAGRDEILRVGVLVAGAWIEEAGAGRAGIPSRVRTPSPAGRSTPGT